MPSGSQKLKPFAIHIQASFLSGWLVLLVIVRCDLESQHYVHVDQRLGDIAIVNPIGKR